MEATTTFVGRRAEVDQLTSAAVGAGGQPSTWLIGGDAGVGKTSLIEEVKRTVPEAGVVFASGRCLHTAHGSLPFVPVIEALRALVRAFDAATVAEAATAIDHLHVLLPELGGTDDEPSHAADSGEARVRLFDDVATFVSRLAQVKRVCLVIEDLHWADASTRDLLVFLVHSLSDTSATLFGTYRSDDLSRTHPFRPVLAELDRDALVEHLAVDPLEDDEVVELATLHFGEPPTARMLDELLQRSGGNPFFAKEILDSFSSGRRHVRPQLTDLILSRVTSLSEPTQATLRLVALGGNHVREELLEHVSELDEAALPASLREAIEHQVIVADDDGLRFRHALMQEAVYGTLLSSERRRGHAAYARALSDHPDLTSASDAYDGELAWHLREARHFDAAVRASVAAARSSEAGLAFPEALSHVENALELWDHSDDSAQLAGASHAEVLAWAARLASAIGDFPREVLYHRATLNESPDISTGDRAILLSDLARALRASGRADDAIVHYELALSTLPPGDRSEARATVLAGFGQQLMLSLRSDDAVEMLREALDISREVGALETEGHALNSLGTVLLHQGSHNEGLQMLTRAIEIAEMVKSPGDVLRAHLNLSSGLNAVGDLLSAEKVAVEGIRLATQLGFERSHGFFLSAAYADTLCDMGRWDAADEAVAHAKLPEGELAQPWLLYSTIDRQFRTGDLDAARVAIESIDAAYLHARDAQFVPQRWARAAELALATDDLDGCATAISEGMEAGGNFDSALLLTVLAIELEGRRAGLAATSGDRHIEAARRHQDAVERAVAERLDTGDERSHRIHALRAQARAEVATLEGTDATQLWIETARHWANGPFPWHHARALLRLGSAHLSLGDREAGRAALDECVDIARSISAALLRVEAEKLIDAAGLHREVTEAELLTPRELSVIRLVSDGLTNRQIGEELFISAKTVSVHVSRVLQKLEVSNRTEAAARARSAGLI